MGTIKLKNGTDGAPSSLVQGEPAINVTTGLFYYGSGSGNVVKTLSNFTDITGSGNISASGDISATGHITASGNISSSGTIIGTIDGGSF